MTIEEYFGDWMKVIDRESLNSTLNKLNLEYKRKPICPTADKVFKAFELCPYNDLKVVMLGQDFYKLITYSKRRVLNKQGELLGHLSKDNQQPSQPLTKLEGSETNS